MKKKFSNKWIGSKQPRKQRKYIANAPLHIRKKLMSANLSKELRKKHGRRNISIRKGDTVKIMRGKFKGKTGKVEIVSLKRMRVTVEKMQTQKKDGTKINVYFKPSKLQIQELNVEDKKRLKEIKQEVKVEKKEEKKEEKGKVEKK